MNIPERIIDAHHHLWDLDICHYPWLMEKGVKRFFGDPAPIQKNYLPPDFRQDFGDLPVRKSVHIQVGVDESDAINETVWLQNMAQQFDLPHAIVAFADLTASDLAKNLDAHGAANNLRGVRQIVGRSSAEDAKTGTSALLDNPVFRAGLILLGKNGLSFDLQLTPPLMERAAELFNSTPETPLALCHCGSLSDFSPEGVQQWGHGLHQLARHDNILCKISGFGMFDHNWSEDSIRDYVRRAIDIFGPGRVAFGSNFPVDKLYGSYGDVMGSYLEITADFSDSERDAMFHDNAAKFYRI